MNPQPANSPAALPLTAWRTDLQAAVDEIQQLGLEIVATHSEASELAAKRSRGWRLAERQQEEHAALCTVVAALSGILEALQTARATGDPQGLRTATEILDRHLPPLEAAFVTVRHAAFDLLLWTRRSGLLEDSPLPDRYRKAYATLVSYSPLLKPWLAGFQDELLERSRTAEEGSPVPALHAAVVRMNASLEIARGFVNAITDPPLELVFRETNLFLQDLEALATETRAALATEINDTCEFLLYDHEEFLRRVARIDRPLPGGLETSLLLRTAGDHDIIFSVDEDPLFQELIVTLYRLVPTRERTIALDGIIDHLHQSLGHAPSPPS